MDLTILNVHLDCRAVWHLARPHIKILSFPRLEEENIVAVVQFSQLVQLIQLRFRVKLGVLAAMGHHGREVVEKVSVSAEPRSPGQPLYC